MALLAAMRSSRAPAMARGFSSVQLPELPYSYSALEPVISGEIMELHHAKHHQTYVNNYNAAGEQLAEAVEKGDTPKIITLESPIKFNGGGHVNHSIFWKNLTPPKDFTPPSGELAKALEAEFGSLDNFISKFNPKAAAVQGSGWGWLGYNKETGRLQIATTSNQDPLVLQGLTPLLGIDVWEHAYYLQYKNKRPDYLKEIWKVVNWKDVGARYSAAKSG